MPEKKSKSDQKKGVERSKTCQHPDRDIASLKCGYPLPCPHHQKPIVTRKEIENAVGDTSDEYLVGVFELFEEKGFIVEGRE